MSCLPFFMELDLRMFYFARALPSSIMGAEERFVTARCFAAKTLQNVIALVRIRRKVNPKFALQ